MSANLPVRIAAAFPISLVLLTAPAEAHKNETQIWLSQGAAVKLDATTIAIDLSERPNAQSAAKDQHLARFSITQAVAKGVELGGGFTWSRVGQVDEYRPFEEITLTKGMLALRTRLEQRMFDNADGTVWRLRQRLQVSRSFDRARRWTLTANGEVMVNLNSANVAPKTGLTQFRTQIGLRRALTEQLSLALAYQRQQTIVSGGEDLVTHQPILSLSARF